MEQAALYEVQGNEIFALADRLKALWDRKADLDEQIKAVNAEIEEVERALSEAMVAEEMQNFTRNGLTFYLLPKLYVSPVAERKQEFFAWLRANGFGDMIQETVNANTLRAWVKEQMEENNDELPEDLKPLLNVHEEIGVGIRKAPARKR